MCYRLFSLHMYVCMWTCENWHAYTLYHCTQPCTSTVVNTWYTQLQTVAAMARDGYIHSCYTLHIHSSSSVQCTHTPTWGMHYMCTLVLVSFTTVYPSLLHFESDYVNAVMEQWVVTRILYNNNMHVSILLIKHHLLQYIYLNWYSAALSTSHLQLSLVY